MPWWRARLTRVDELWPPVVGAAAANKGESHLSVGIAIGFVAWQPPPPPSLFPILYLLRGERRRESQCPSHIVTQLGCQGRKRSEERRQAGCPTAASRGRSARPRSTSSSTWGTPSSTGPSTASSRSARSVVPLLHFILSSFLHITNSQCAWVPHIYLYILF